MEAPIRDLLGNTPIPQSWVTWFKTVDNFIRSGSSSGTTANRPTKNLFVGLSYMDNDLGKQIQIQSLNPTIWVDSNGDNPDVPAPVVTTVYPMNVGICQYSTPTAFATALFVMWDGYALSGGGARKTSAIAVLLDGHTQARMLVTYNGGAPPAGFMVTVAYSTTTAYYPAIDMGCSAAVTSTLQMVDSGWVNLPSGLNGLIYCSPAVFGGNNAAGAGTFEGMTLLLK